MKADDCIAEGELLGIDNDDGKSEGDNGGVFEYGIYSNTTRLKPTNTTDPPSSLPNLSDYQVTSPTYATVVIVNGTPSIAATTTQQEEDEPLLHDHNQEERMILIKCVYSLRPAYNKNNLEEGDTMT